MQDNAIPRESKPNIPEMTSNWLSRSLAVCLRFPTMFKKSFSAFTLVVLAGTANATWQQEMDLLSAGAAASVVSMHSCVGELYSENANKFAATKLMQAAQRMPDSDEAYEYASNAFELKVKAMWQSSGGECENSRRLQDIARATGFLIPNVYE